MLDYLTKIIYNDTRKQKLNGGIHMSKHTYNTRHNTESTKKSDTEYEAFQAISKGNFYQLAEISPPQNSQFQNENIPEASNPMLNRGDDDYEAEHTTLAGMYAEQFGLYDPRNTDEFISSILRDGMIDNAKVYPMGDDFAPFTDKDL